MLDFVDDGDKNKKKSESTTPVLDNFSKDLNKLAEQGKLDPIIGRKKEIIRIIDQYIEKNKTYKIFENGNSSAYKNLMKLKS